MNQIVTLNNNWYNDQLISLIKQNFNESDIQLFELNYKFYITNKNNPNEFTIDFDEVYKWIGYNKKSDAKKVLIKENNGFKINIDFIIKNEIGSFAAIAAKVSGRPKEIILLTINCFKKFCLKAATKEADKIYDYYIKMEDIISKYIENKHNEILQETNQLIEIKNKEIKEKNDELDNIKKKNIKYDEIGKTQYVYIFSTDKENIYKVGSSKDVKKRAASLQTGNVDDIITHKKYPTSDSELLEKIIHNILDNYRYKPNREHFFCDLEYIKLIIDISGCFLDTLKSTYQYITKKELLDKINDKIFKIKSDINIFNNINLIDPLELEDNNLIPEVIINNNPIKLFLSSQCIITTNKSDQIKTSDLYNYYLNKNCDKISIVKFIDFMKSNNIETINKKGYKYFTNIKILNTISDDDSDTL